VFSAFTATFNVNVKAGQILSMMTRCAMIAAIDAREFTI
jgi:hypothetical protein